MLLAEVNTTAGIVEYWQDLAGDYSVKFNDDVVVSFTPASFHRAFSPEPSDEQLNQMAKKSEA